MVVAIIVAILAAVAIPLMSGNKRRAMATEAESTLGQLRTQMRVNYAETGRYDKDSGGNTIDELYPNGGGTYPIPGARQEDLDGKYWTHSQYSIVGTITSNAYTFQVTSTTGQTANITITLDQDGTFTRSGL
jgi:type II secretory pathway pseudopilin PulG